jgi:hypothetical protein
MNKLVKKNTKLEQIQRKVKRNRRKMQRGNIKK